MQLSETNLVIIPGSSRYTRYWAEDLHEVLDDSFKFVNVHKHRHWREIDDKNIEVYTEAGVLYEYKEELDSFGIIAYAEGALPVLKAVHEEKISPIFCIFVSFPYYYSYHSDHMDEVRQWSSGFKVPTLFIQADHDPMAEIDSLKEFINDRFQRHSLKVISGNDSNYDDLYEISSICKEFVKKV